MASFGLPHRMPHHLMKLCKVSCIKASICIHLMGLELTLGVEIKCLPESIAKQLFDQLESQETE